MSIHDQPNINLLIGILEAEFDKQSLRHPQFVEFFNNKLENYHERRFNYTDLGELNKHMLSDCFQYISRQNNEIEKNTMVLKPPPSHSHTFQTPSNNTKQQDSNKQSDATFDNYKKQYDTMLNPKKPGKIDFSDTIEDQPIQNIDSIVNQTLEDRQKELERITNTYSEKPPDWVKPPVQDTTLKHNQPMKLIIEDSESKQRVSLPSSILKTKPSLNKKVTFKTPVEKVTVNNLLNKLKLKQPTSSQPLPSQPLPSYQNNDALSEIEKRVYDKIEAKFTILNEKYNQLQSKYEELSMKYGELIIPHDTLTSMDAIH
jgi:hypothetical protein